MNERKITLEEVERLEQQINMMQDIIDVAEDKKKNMFIHFTQKIKEADERVEQALEGLEETKKAMNAVLLQFALEHGCKIKGGYKIEICKPNISELEVFKVTADVAEDKYVITVVERKDEQVQK